MPRTKERSELFPPQLLTDPPLFGSIYEQVPIFHKMWILPLIGYAGVLLGFAFLTLAIGKVYKHSSPRLKTVKYLTSIPNSKWPLLSLRARRRAYRPRAQATHPSHLHCHRVPSPPCPHRPLSPSPLRPQYRQPCRLSGQPTTFPHCQAQ